MESKFIDILLVEKVDGSVALVSIETCTADIGYIVEFNDGELGRVEQKASCVPKNGEVHALIGATLPVFEAEAAYWQSWKAASEGDSNEDSGAS